METSPQDQLNEIVSDFERRLGDLRDAQQMMIRQLETDKVVLKTQMEERSAQLERQRAEIAAERRQVEAERAELDRVWAAVRELSEMMGKGPVKLEVSPEGKVQPEAHDTPQPAEDRPADHGEGHHDGAQHHDAHAFHEHDNHVDHDGWSVRYAA